MTTPPSGWYPDPVPGGGWRYWDGQAWTDQAAPTVPPGGWGTTPHPTPSQGGGRGTFIARMVALVVAGLVAAQVATIAYGVFSYMLPLGDLAEETDWSTQPLEIVADAEEPACVLNVGAVAPGRHEVYVIAVETSARVLIKDPGGEVVLRVSAEADAQEGGVTPSAQFREMGTYRVECHHAGGATTTEQLRVVPADEAAQQ